MLRLSLGFSSLLLALALFAMWSSEEGTSSFEDRSLENQSVEAQPLTIDPDLHSRHPRHSIGQGQGPCPMGQAGGGMGPAMTRLPEGFCIDQTEVTRGQYAAWLETSPAIPAEGACAENDDLTPTCAWEPGRNDDQPVVCVDWCDAQAFCQAAGKRLCGQIDGGGAYDPAEYADAEVSEWFAACSSGGRYEYTYGNEMSTTHCRGADAEDYRTWGMTDVGSLPECHSPEGDYGDIYDLSGMVAEWDNSCEGDNPEDGCRIRGGSWEHNGIGLRCAMAADLRWPRMRRVGAVGFRCCAD